jgi:hypothetical protein
MKLETILDAMVFSRMELSLEFQGVTRLGLSHAMKRSRQYRAFRARILRMFDFENNAQKIAIEAYKAVIKQQQQRIEELEKVLDVEYVPKLKKRIAELEEQPEPFHGPFDEPLNDSEIPDNIFDGSDAIEDMP